MAEKTPSLRWNLLVCLALGLLVAAVYYQVWSFNLVGLDDDSYITQNAYTLLGLRGDSVRWAFTAVYQGIWHPMIWLSYMADTDAARWLMARHIAIGPGNTGVYHVSNCLQHLLSSVLLYLILLRLTGSRWRGAFVAAVFAVHPLNVESVAWVAERKNTLSTLFAMLTMLAYVGYVRNPGRARYVLTLALFALGLMAKAVLVTVPVMLLLIDYWPLERYENTSLRRMLLEKLPMFALSAAAGVMAFIAQRKGGLVAPDDVFPLGVRIANAFVSFWKYVWLMILPRNLSVCYVHPGRSLPTLLVVLCAAALIAVTVLAIRHRKAVPYLFVGWLWYLATILPVIGLVQVADQGLADRYIYIPMIGLLIAAAWGLPELMSRFASPRLSPVLAAAACLVLIAFTTTANKQASYWRDSITMYRQVIKVNPTSRTGYSGLGSALAARGEHEEAQKCLQKAIEIDPRDITSRINLALDLAMQKKLDDACYYLRDALEMSPGEPKACYNLARILVMQRKMKEAAEYYEQAVKSQPAFVEAQIDLANTLMVLGRTREALEHYEKALELRPESAGTHILIAGALEEQKRIADAIEHYRQALRLNPKRWDAANNLAWILATDSRHTNPREAVSLAEESCRQVGDRDPQLLDTLAVAYAADGRYRDAAAAARRAIALAESSKQPRMASELRQKLQRYESLASGRS